MSIINNNALYISKYVEERIWGFGRYTSVVEYSLRGTRPLVQSLAPEK
jgi:hypothetical protein